jgi:predicted Na+-dependent transporter
VGSVGFTAVGFILGMIVVPLLIRWAALLYTTLGLHGGDFLGQPKRRLLWAAPLFLLVHPAPYFIVWTVVVAILAARGRIPGGWVWLLAGFWVYALFIGLITTRVFLKARKRARTARNA